MATLEVSSNINNYRPDRPQCCIQTRILHYAVSNTSSVVQNNPMHGLLQWQQKKDTFPEVT